MPPANNRLKPASLKRFFYFFLFFSFLPRSGKTQGLYFQGGSQSDVKSNPFVMGPYGNCAFNPQRLGAKTMVSFFSWNDLGLGL